MRILMVCLGNICRSPLAEGILRQKTESLDLDIQIDSAGTSDYHIGESPDERSSANALTNGLDISYLRARQFVTEDFDRFDKIYVMDRSNKENVLRLSRGQTDAEKVDLILNLSHPGSDMEVPDPYFGGTQGFQHVFDLLDKATDRIIDELNK